MKVIAWGQQPRPDHWWLHVEHRCPHCDPPTIYVSEWHDVMVRHVADLFKGNSLFHDQLQDQVITICPNCGGDVTTTKPEEATDEVLSQAPAHD